MNKNIIKIKRRIKELEHALHEFNILVSEYTDPDVVLLFYCREIIILRRQVCKEYAKLGVSMTDLSDDEKEKWK